MSCCYRYPCYSVCYLPCYRTMRHSRTYSCCNPCNYQILYRYQRRYNCGDCCSYGTARMTRYYYPSCCSYGYRCCYPCC